MIKGVPARMIFLLVLQRVFFVLPLVFVLPSCTANPATGQNSFTAFMSPQEEIQVGRKEHPKILKEFGGEYQGSQFNAYVCNVGLKLAKVSDMPNLNFTITVLNDSKVNAFALSVVMIARRVCGGDERFHIQTCGLNLSCRPIFRCLTNRIRLLPVALKARPSFSIWCRVNKQKKFTIYKILWSRNGAVT